MKARLSASALTWLSLSTEIYHQGLEATRLGDKTHRIFPPLSWPEVSMLLCPPEVFKQLRLYIVILLI